MLSDAKELASDQQLDADVRVVGAVATGISIARELSGNGVSVWLPRIRRSIHCSGWPFDSTASGSLRPRTSDVQARAVQLRPTPRVRPALESPRFLLLSRRAHRHGCSNPTLPVVALALRLADHIKKQLVD